MRKKCISILWLIVIMIICNIGIIIFANVDKERALTIQYELTSDIKGFYQLLYSNEKFKEHNIKVITTEYSTPNVIQRIENEIPKNTKFIRLDLGDQPGKIQLKDVKIKYFKYEQDLMDKVANQNIEIKDINNISLDSNILNVTSIGTDPFIVLKLDNIDMIKINKIDQINNSIFKITLCFIVTLLLLLGYKAIPSIQTLGLELYHNRILIWNLSKNDFKTKYAGSYLGITWAFIQPIVTVLVYWFVFQVGFKAAPVENFPFVLWLVAGMVPWFFFNDAIMNAANSLIEYNYLVKKVVFKISILPIVKIISALFVHLFFITFLMVMFIGYGYIPNLYTLQVFYYSFCVFILVLGISYITSSVIIFLKDLGQIIAIFLQVGMWMTPILWDSSIISQKYQWILKLNPMYYIVEGYRDALINGIWFWEKYNQTIYFWIVTIALFVLGTIIFKRLKPHFADVL